METQRKVSGGDFFPLHKLKCLKSELVEQSQALDWSVERGGRRNSDCFHESSSNPRVLVYTYNDASWIYRLGKLARIIDGFEVIEASVVNYHQLLSDRNKFDVLIVSGDDTRRIKSNFYSREYNLIEQKVSFALSDITNPSRRSTLLRLGFDDVLTCRMADEEIAIRLFSIANRAYEYKHPPEQRFHIAFTKFCSRHAQKPLGNGDRKRLSLLYRKKNSIVRYSELANFDLETERYKLESLKVQISRLRNKLIHCKIVNVSKLGYMLIVKDNNQEESRKS